MENDRHCNAAKKKLPPPLSTRGRFMASTLPLFTFHCQHAKQEKKLHETGENAKLFKLFVSGSIANLLIRFLFSYRNLAACLLVATHSLFDSCTNSFRRFFFGIH